ncbi:MAG TPA: hypothetical protein VGM87_11445 [Roseomonas sp.]|jgi:hypothetical protein
MMVRARLPGGLMILALLAGPAAGQTADGRAWSQDPGTRCRFVAPRSLTAGPTTWSGACPDGRASGIGMLRRRDGAVAGFAFFGKMRDGIPQLGVVDLGDGYQAGRFTAGDIGVERSVEMQVTIDAFTIAATAARAVSARYAAEHNAASARYYESIAKTLENQIE